MNYIISNIIEKLNLLWFLNLLQFLRSLMAFCLLFLIFYFRGGI